MITTPTFPAVRLLLAGDVACTPKDYGEAVITNALSVLATRLTVEDILAVLAAMPPD